MASAPGPWDPQPPSPRAPGKPSGRSSGLLVGVVVLAVLALGLWFIADILPTHEFDRTDIARIISLGGFALLLSAGIFAARSGGALRAARDLLAWAAIALVLALGYSFKDELRPVGARLLAGLIPGYAASAGEDTLVLNAGADGHFHIVGSVNGASVRFLVDTGASDIVLSPADAARAGLDVAKLSYSRVYETANGPGRGAPVVLDSLAIGPIRRQSVRAAVNQAEMRGSLLGMAFFRDIATFEIRGSTLLIRWR
jgi:aspartyl protease family protein